MGVQTDYCDKKDRFIKLAKELKYLGFEMQDEEIWGYDSYTKDFRNSIFELTLEAKKFLDK